MKSYLFLIIGFIFSSLQSAYGQISTNELPVSIRRGLNNALSKDNLNGSIDLSVPDIKKILHEDSLNMKNRSNAQQRTSVPIAVSLDIKKDGVWTDLGDGGKLWQMKIHAEKAYALDFVFSKFWLPEGGKFFIFNPSTKEAIGAITSQYLLGKQSNPHRFSTGIVKGDDIVLEYYQPARVKESPVVIVEKAYYTYIPVPGFNTSCPDEVNVNCSEGANWQLEKNAVALVYGKFEQGGVWCSGSLVNNVLNDGTPYFLTADHCLEGDFTAYGGYIEKKDAITDNDLSDWVFYWGYEQTDCNGVEQPSYSKTTIGATLLSNNSYSDFALFQLHQNPLALPFYTPYYLGWDASGNSGTGGVCIHHPQHDVKKISTYDGTPQSGPSDWQILWLPTINGYGIVEEGSSGAPLINNNYKVIGQLRGGLTECDYQSGKDYFGKFSVSWTGNDAIDNRRKLNCWLDPNGTNTQVLNGINPLELLNLAGPNTVCGTEEYFIENLPLNCTVDWDIDTENDFSVNQSGNLCELEYIGSEPAYKVVNLSAYVFCGSKLLSVLSKRIVTHSADMLVTGQQNGYVSTNGVYPDRQFTIPSNNNSRTAAERIIFEDVAEKESLPIDFVEDSNRDHIHPPVDWCGYGITEIDGGNMVYLNSTRFDGMDISFFGAYSPTYYYHSGSTVVFTVPYDVTDYTMRLQASSNNHCDDFCLTFNVVPLPGASIGDDQIWVNLSGSTLYVTFMGVSEPIGNGQYYFPSYNVRINKVPAGTQVYSGTFLGTQDSFSVNTGSWSSGLYSIRIVQNGHIYTKTIYL